jgi:hypothetical protein
MDLETGSVCRLRHQLKDAFMTIAHAGAHRILCPSPSSGCSTVGVESDQRSLPLLTMGCLQQQVCRRWQADREIQLAALLQMEGRSRAGSRPIVVTPRPFDPTVEESFGMIKEGYNRVCLIRRIGSHCRRRPKRYWRLSFVTLAVCFIQGPTGHRISQYATRASISQPI